MIEKLHIQNIGIIDDTTIDLKQGFNVLTGESGAGKSLVINSLNVLCGGRFSKEMIRKGAEMSFVEAVISEDSNNDFCVVSREVHTNGKNICKINGRFVIVTELKEFMKNIVDIHGQYDSQSLMDEKEHIKLLDGYCKKNSDVELLLNQYSNLFESYKKIKEKLAQNYGDDIEKQRKLDLLNYQINEIEEADLREDEEEQLEEEKTKMLNYEKLSTSLNLATYTIENSLLDNFDDVIKPLEKIEHLDSVYTQSLMKFKDMYYEIQDILDNLNKEKDMLEYDEQKFKYAQERLDLIFNLKRKYGNDIQSIINYKNELVNTRDEILNLEEINNKLKEELKEYSQKLELLAKKIHDIRVKNAHILEIYITENIKDLEMKNASLKVEVIYNSEKEFTLNGKDEVRFLINTNLGEDFKPLSKIASGGEISRIMLAIKTVLNSVCSIPTIIFDEIDTGISGIASKKVASKIKEISKSKQVIAITHQPILAACADYNFRLEKSVECGKTTTQITLLNEKEIIEEIAKISTGDVTNLALQHALELRNTLVAC